MDKGEVKFSCDGDYRLQEKWLEQHKSADQIIYDNIRKLPAYAIYISPIYQAYVLDVKQFLDMIKQLSLADLPKEQEPTSPDLQQKVDSEPQA